MTDVLYAKGYSKTDGVTPIYFWGLGSYKYEIERRPIGHSRITNSNVFEASYEEAVKKFEKMVDKVVFMWYNELNLESIPNGLSYIAEVLGGLMLSLFYPPAFIWAVTCKL